MPCTSILKIIFWCSLKILWENLMAPFGFPLMDLFWSIFRGKMSEGKTTDVVAQKTRFGVKNRSTMPLAECPLLCKKWTLALNNHYKNENSHKIAPWTAKGKKSKQKSNPHCQPLFNTGTLFVPSSLSLRCELFYFRPMSIAPHIPP